jgi:hypothetical protein
LQAGVLRSRSVGIGASVPVAEVTRHTKAIIGNDPDDSSATDDSGSITCGGSIGVIATNSGYIANVGVAGTYSTNMPVDPATPPKNAYGAGYYGIAISGDFSVNDIEDHTLAFVRQATISSATALTVRAQNSTEYMTLGGAVAISANSSISSTNNSSLAGSAAVNTIDNHTKAYIDSSSITISGALTVTA